MRRFTFVFLAICMLMILAAVVHARFFTGIVNSARAGNTVRLEQQLQSRGDDGILKRVLNYAIVNNRPDTVRMLLKHMNLSDLDNSEEETPLRLASRCGSGEIVRLLIQNGADVNGHGRGDNDNTPLSEALSNQRFDAAAILVENGADVNTYGFGIVFDGQQEKMKKREMEFIRLCISRGADMKGKFGSGALDSAIRAGNRQVIDSLLQKGAGFSKNAMWFAVGRNDVDLLKYLVGKGLDLDSPDAVPSLSTAIRLKNVEMLSFLLEAGVPAASKDSYALTTAAEENNVEAAKLLVKNGANPNGGGIITNDNPLLTAVWKGNKEMVKLLLENGAAVNLKDKPENFLFDVLGRIRDENVDWFDFSRKKDCEEIYQLLNEYRVDRRS